MLLLLLLLLFILLLAMLLFMLMLSVFAVAACVASVATPCDVCAYVVVSGNANVAAISTVAAAFNIFVTRTYMCTLTVRTVRI